MANGAAVSAVDLTNFAEASRSMFKLDEAERVSLEATTALPSWFGNPWMELAELYVRQGRFGEALSALKQVPAYRMKRPPHVRDADRNEMRRVLASFLLMLSKPEQAFEVTGRAIAAPERRAHNSRDPGQDRTVLALLDRRARLMSAQLVLERGASEPWYKRPLEWATRVAVALAGARAGRARAAHSRRRQAPGRLVPHRHVERGGDAAVAGRRAVGGARSGRGARSRAPRARQGQASRRAARTTTRRWPKPRGAPATASTRSSWRSVRSLRSARRRCCCRRA